MKYVEDSFRWGREHLSNDDDSWMELVKTIESISREDVVAKKGESFKQWIDGKRKSPAVGGQSIFNTIFEEKLKDLGWEDQIFVLDLEKSDSDDEDVLKRENYWTMDFKKGLIGLEISFNNAGVLAQNLLRLSVMSETRNRKKEDKIRLGILLTATKNLKKWSNMDDTVITFETVQRVFPAMNFNIPTPVILVGIDSVENTGEIWEKSELFGHQKLMPFKDLSISEKSDWEIKLRDSGVSF